MEIPLGLFPLPAPVGDKRAGYYRTEETIELFSVPSRPPVEGNVSAPELMCSWALRMTDHLVRPPAPPERRPRVHARTTLSCARARHTLTRTHKASRTT